MFVPIVYRVWASARMVQLEDWFKFWVPDSVVSAGVVVGRWKLGILFLLIFEGVLTGAVDTHVHLIVADVVKSFDSVDREILDGVLNSLGLPAWFRHAYFEYHLHVRLRFKLAAGLGEPWNREGGISQGVPIEHDVYCRLSRDPVLLLSAARFTTGYVRLVGQEPAPSKCVLVGHFQGG